MNKSRPFILILALLSSATSLMAFDQFNSDFTMSIDAQANVISDPANRQDVTDIFYDQLTSVEASDITGNAYADALYSLTIASDNLNFTFQGSAHASGEFGSFPTAQSAFQLTFVTTDPIQYDFFFETVATSSETPSQVTAQIYLSGLPGGLLRFGENGEPEENGHLQGVLQPGNYALGASVYIYSQLAEAGFESGQFAGHFTLGVPPEPSPEPSTWAMLVAGGLSLLFAQRQRFLSLSLGR